MTQKTQDSNQSGARRPLSTELIVRAAMGLLDHSGPEGLTFRILASELNVGVASLYTHIDSKNTLLLKCLETLVAERLGSLSEAPDEAGASEAASDSGAGEQSTDAGTKTPGAGTPDDAGTEQLEASDAHAAPDADADWAQALVDILTPVYELCEDHPWLALVSDVVPVTGADLGMPLWNRVAAVIHGLGFDDETTFILAATLVGHLTSLMDQRMRSAYITGPLLEDATSEVEPRAFHMSSVEALRRAGAFSREHFDAGLQVIIDGIRAQAARLPSESGGRTGWLNPRRWRRSPA